MSSQDSEQYLEFKKDTGAHALLAGFSFLVVLPAGILIARYMRTFINRWLHAHWIINGLLGFPLILAAWAKGRNAHHLSSHTSLTSHGERGLFIIGLYVAQLVLGLFIHYIRIPFPLIGHRPLQNYLHVLLGLVTLALANHQVYDGVTHKTSFLDTDVRQSARRAWMALFIIFWFLYAIGLIFLRRQYMQERRVRLEKEQEAYKLRSAP